MKKNVFYFVLLAGIVMFFSSCITTLIGLKVHKAVVDESVPKDQTVIVTFVNNLSEGWFQVQEWNNEFSSKKLGEDLYGKDGAWSNQKTQLTVPAGNNTFVFDVNYTFTSGNTDTTYPLKAIELRYNLEQGKKYRINGIIKRIDGSAKMVGLLSWSYDYELFVAIYDVTGKKDILLKEWKLGETDQ